MTGRENAGENHAIPLTRLPISKLLAEYWTHDGDFLRSLWIDWFCPEDQLARRGRNLMMRVRELASSPLFDDRDYRVFFKNLHEPEPYGEDQIHIVPIDENSPLPSYVVSPPSTDGGLSSYWLPPQNGKGGPVFGSGTWVEVLQSVFGVALPSSLISPVNAIPPGEKTWPVTTIENVRQAFSGIASDLFRGGDEMDPDRRKELAMKLVVSEQDVFALYDVGFDPASDLGRARCLTVTKCGIAVACDCQSYWAMAKRKRRTLLVPWHGIGWLQFQSGNDKRVLKCGSCSESKPVWNFQWDWDAEIEATKLPERDLRILCDGIRNLAETATGEEVMTEPEK